MNLSELLFINRRYPIQTVRELIILLCLLANGGRIRFDRIAKMIDLPKPSISRAFDSLCTKKLIKRERDRNDARRVFAVLTDVGRKYVVEIAG